LSFLLVCRAILKTFRLAELMYFMRTYFNLFALLFLSVGCAQFSQIPEKEDSLLTKIEQRGLLLCGVSGVLPGFSKTDANDKMAGFDADLCRAIAAAVLGDGDKVRYIPLDAVARFTALADGTIDVLVRNTTWTLSRDTKRGLVFAGVNYYDGQGFMVKRSLGVASAQQLAGVSVCTQRGSTSQLNMADYFRVSGMSYQPIIYDSFAKTREGFDKGECDVLTTDLSQLAAIRTQLTEPQGAIILPEIISKEPLGPVVREGDEQWFRIVKWTLFALINAEEEGVTKDNVAQLRSESQEPNIRRLLGQEGNIGEGLGLNDDWAYKAIRSVGNYGEIFDRHLGPTSELELPRGLNRLWSDGGILYAPPIR